MYKESAQKDEDAPRTPAKASQYFGILLDQCQVSKTDSPEIAEPQNLIFTEVNEASSALKRYRGSRMKAFSSRDLALDFVNQSGSFLDDSMDMMAASFERSLSLKPQPKDRDKDEEERGGSGGSNEEKRTERATEEAKQVEEEEKFSSPTPANLALLRKAIESGDYVKVEEIIWSNPRCLVTVCDSAVYLMAGPKYNACHIASRANKPDIMALILDTVSNNSFLRKLYTKESDQNIHDRKNHLLDSYLNTPDPRQGNTPLHFACKLGHYKVVRILLTFEGCDLSLRDRQGKTAEECICAQSGDSNSGDGGANLVQKMKDMFKVQLNGPLQKDQLKKMLLLTKRRSSTGSPTASPSSSSNQP